MKIKFLLLSLFIALTACQATVKEKIDYDGIYTSKGDVSLYLHTYRKLPKNFITKNQARQKGWRGGGLDYYVKNGCIGGDRFGNYERRLPADSYKECDIDTLHRKSRGKKRLIYSKDFVIYYTDDHYQTFTKITFEE